MIHVRYDRVSSLAFSGKDCCGFVICDQIAVPDKGDIINLKEYPYVVLKVSWSVGHEDDEIYAYIRVLPACKEGWDR